MHFLCNMKNSSIFIKVSAVIFCFSLECPSNMKSEGKIGKFVGTRISPSTS